ncbi:Amidase [Penicillium verhagenii]|nr:Amidase [Penicillium verhagenii]
MSWELIAAAKRQALQDSIPSEWVIPSAIFPPEDQLDVTTFPRESEFFTEFELEITSTPASEILSHITNGSWTSVEVTNAFCKTAAVAQQLTNCLSEIFFERAIEQAKELDAYLQRTGKTKGPFHGLPISIKDNFNVLGYDTTIGFTSLVKKPATYNSTLINFLIEAETVNNLFGRTVNPLNRNLTTGGSSGGEAALIAFGGSRIGVGSDIGGSLRMPAACTGLFTIRPSFGRFPNFGARACLEGQESVNGVCGPMAKTLEEIVLWASTIVDQQPWTRDPKCLPIPWRSVETKKSLRIAVLWDDGVVRPTPPVSRALKETVEKLMVAGHEIVTWEPTGHTEILKILEVLFFADGGKSLRDLLEPTGEPFRPEMKLYEEAQGISVYDLWQTHVNRNSICKSYLDRWNNAGIDAILCPTTPYSSIENGKFTYVGYSCVWNLLDYPAVSFPCGLNADKGVDAPFPDYQPLNPWDAKVQNDYSAESVHGIPVSLQLVGRKLGEESLLDMTDIVLKAIGL